jgi:hypothetical protein
MLMIRRTRADPWMAFQPFIFPPTGLIPVMDSNCSGDGGTRKMPNSAAMHALVVPKSLARTTPPSTATQSNPRRKVRALLNIWALLRGFCTRIPRRRCSSDEGKRSRDEVLDLNGRGPGSEWRRGRAGPVAGTRRALIMIFPCGGKGTEPVP